MTGVIILAAGSSSRMGTAKQNLLYKGRTLLQTAVDTALKCRCATIAVVLGANADKIAPTIEDQPVKILINKNWAEGMGTSISFGVSETLKINPEISSLIILLADQPLINTNILINLIARAQPGKIIASAYNNTLGPPILFDEKYFPDLLKTKGQEGAKKLINKYTTDVIQVEVSEGITDIDTPEDYKFLTQN